MPPVDGLPLYHNAWPYSELYFLTVPLQFCTMLIGKVALPDQITAIGTVVAVCQILTISAMRRIGQTLATGAVIAVDLHR
jgi:hypothetical protein